MKNLIGVVIYIVTVLPIAQVYSQSSLGQESWVSLFNGKNLNGWDMKIAGFELDDNYNNTFVVEDGLLRVKYDEYDSFNNEFGHLFHRTPYSYYRLKVEYRFIGKQVAGGPGWAYRNNGMMLHAQSAQSMGIDQDFPISIEAQLLGGTKPKERSTSNLCTPGTHVNIDGELVTEHCINSSSKTYYGDQWVIAEFVILGDSIIHHIMGQDTVLTYTNPIVGGGEANNTKEGVKVDGSILSEGYITIQAESHPTDFRQIEILDLKGCMDPDAQNYKSHT